MAMHPVAPDVVDDGRKRGWDYELEHLCGTSVVLQTEGALLRESSFMVAGFPHWVS
jgi:hypothetical protein